MAFRRRLRAVLAFSLGFYGKHNFTLLSNKFYKHIYFWKGEVIFGCLRPEKLRVWDASYLLSMRTSGGIGKFAIGRSYLQLFDILEKVS